MLRYHTVLIVTALVAALASQALAADDANPIAARFDGQTITVGEVDAAAASKLLRVRTDEYRVRRAAADEVINEKLLAREAARRNITVAQLLATEVAAKIEQPNEELISSIYDATKDKFGGLPEEGAKAQIASNLVSQRAATRKAQFVASLRERAHVAMLLEPPRVAMDTGGAPSLGPESARVIIVEFSDFECPFCGKASAMLKQLLERYPKDVRLVFRQFPLSFHQNAALAARAAVCGAGEDKFWQLHDALFANQRTLNPTTLRQYASAVGIDLAKFDRCMSSPESAALIDREIASGTKYGVFSTPTIFVNGRLVGGAVPLSVLVDVVNEELGTAPLPQQTRASAK